MGERDVKTYLGRTILEDRSQIPFRPKALQIFRVYVLLYHAKVEAKII